MAPAPDPTPSGIVRAFKRAVNMTPAQLQKWLETEDSKTVGFKGAAGGESVGHRSGRRIVRLLQKKMGDLTQGDLAHMRNDGPVALDGMRVGGQQLDLPLQAEFMCGDQALAHIGGEGREQDLHAWDSAVGVWARCWPASQPKVSAGPSVMPGAGYCPPIREAVIGGDAARAEQLMREHVYYAGLILRRNYEALLDAGKDAPGLRPSRRSDDGAPGAG